MILQFNKREVEVEIAGTYDEPFVNAGNYTDGKMEDLTDDECDEICDQHAGEIGQELMEFAMDHAHELAEGDR